MKKLFLLIAFLLISSGSSAIAQREFQSKEGDTTYTMREYFMCFLKTGPNRSHDSVEAAEIQKGHMANINALAKAGKISMAGPFGDNGEIRGILVFNTATKEEAEELASQDPAVKAGRLIVEIHPWWAAKGSVLK